MRFWVREVLGWLLIAFSLYLFLGVYDLLQDNKYFQAGPWVLIGIFVFRGGIHLLKVAVAARVCMQARDRLQAEGESGPVRRPRGRIPGLPR